MIEMAYGSWQIAKSTAEAREIQYFDLAIDKLNFKFILTAD